MMICPACEIELLGEFICHHETGDKAAYTCLNKKCKHFLKLLLKEADGDTLITAEEDLLNYLGGSAKAAIYNIKMSFLNQGIMIDDSQN